MKQLFVRVSVNVPKVRGLFDYNLPDSLEGQVVVGSFVAVPFGKQLVQGIVVSFPEDPFVSETKPVESLVSPEPVVTGAQIQLAEWLSKENFSSLSDCLDLMLPAGLGQHSDIQYELTDLLNERKLTPQQTLLVELLKKRGPIRGRQIDSSLPRVNWRTAMLPLVKSGMVKSRPVLPPPSIRPKFVRTAQYVEKQFAEPGDTVVRKQRSDITERRNNILEFLKEEAVPVNVTWVYAETGANLNDLTQLAETGKVILSETEVWRDPLKNYQPTPSASIKLTAEQDTIVNSVIDQIMGKTALKPNLIEGVTGSGKTEIYLKAVESVLEQNKQAVILVPEISLTPQTVKRFYTRFPSKVGLIHSRLSDGERYDTWRRIRSGQISIVVGPRSALFAPFPDLGLIVIDECHDGSYEQEEFQPHYHTVHTAIQYAQIVKAVLLMGSATPSVEMLYEFAQNKWNIFLLPQRILAHQPVRATSGLSEETIPDAPGNLPLPDIQVVDMRAELVAGNRSALSRVLSQGLREVLVQKEQAILFLNRRGSASYVFCRDCGTVLRCPRCNTQLTYHANEASLRCHQCNYQRQLPNTCPSCGGKNIRQFGMGTESLEKVVSEQFPEARILRWDADTTRFKGAHDLILEHFVNQRADILIGTQMLAKGLDLPHVTLVGMILADISLNLPDFRAAEKSFQLLTQVAGRAGRSSRGGKVILQTFMPDHYVIQKASEYDFEGFKKTELEYREKTGYPPFSRLLKLEFRHLNPTHLEGEVLPLAEKLNAWIRELGMNSTSMIGPVPCFYERRAGLYRWQIILRGPDPGKLIRVHPLSEWQPHGIDADLVVDPIDLL